MSATIHTEITGLKVALAELGKLDTKTKFKATNKIKAAGAEMVTQVASRYPETLPLSGMAPSKKGGTRLAYDVQKVRKGVTIQIGGRNRNGNIPLVTLIQKNAGGAFFDLAGLRDGSSQFVRNLDGRFGKAQRGMWRSRSYIYGQATKDILAAVEEVMNQTSRTLGK
jgi:mRNA-degrading endonuclease RelE of RelBE toxin-antitoxin system